MQQPLSAAEMLAPVGTSRCEVCDDPIEQELMLDHVLEHTRLAKEAIAVLEQKLFPEVFIAPHTQSLSLTQADVAEMQAWQRAVRAAEADVHVENMKKFRQRVGTRFGWKPDKKGNLRYSSTP